jgi:hypothetical protein
MKPRSTEIKPLLDNDAFIKNEAFTAVRNVTPSSTEGHFQRFYSNVLSLGHEFGSFIFTSHFWIIHL